MGSASELEYYLLLCRDIDLLRSVDYEELVGQVDEVKRMLAAYIKKLRADG
jgi:four helix bundle protein